MVNLKFGLALVVLIDIWVAGLGVAHADPDCIGFFVERNRVYAEAHYCFKTPRALEYFSNAGCVPGEPHLTSAQASRVADIQREEQLNNCRTQ